MIICNECKIVMQASPSGYVRIEETYYAPTKKWQCVKCGIEVLETTNIMTSLEPEDSKSFIDVQEIHEVKQ